METMTYQCPNCGGGLIFDPQAQDFCCEFCRGHFTEEQMKEPNRQRQKETPPELDGAMVYRCPSCGAQVVTDETTAATSCYYCHNPVVLEGRLTGEAAPHRLIPFLVTKEEAEKAFLNWAGKKWFVPRDFVCKKQIDQMAGVYFPYWVADYVFHGTLEGQGTKVRTWRTGNTQYTETQYYQVEREGDIRLEDLTKSALKKADKNLVEGVLPFDGSQSKPFDMRYLSGFQAEKRDIGQKDLEPNVQEEAKKYAGLLLRDTVTGYASLRERQNFQTTSAQWSYLLLPVWVLTYRKPGGKVYYYAMNGQTGKVCGKLPVDKIRLAALFGAVSLPLFALLNLVGWFL